MQLRLRIAACLVSTILSTTNYAKMSVIPQGTEFGEPINPLHLPVTFTAHGIQHFLKNTFNHPDYAQKALAHDFSHVIQFLKHGKRMGQKRTYCKSVIRLFTNKLKSTPFVNAYAFSLFLKQLQQEISDYFIIFKLADIDPTKRMIQELSLNHFAGQVGLFKDNPKQFFDDLSGTIVDALNNKFQISEEVTADDLRKSILMMLDLALNKLVWNPEEHTETWQLCKQISDQLALFLETNIISDPDDLNDLYVTLVERYCYFLDITGQDMPLSFFEKLKVSIATDSLSFLEMEEQEKGIETKSERLIRAVIEAEARAYANDVGIIATKKAA